MQYIVNAGWVDDHIIIFNSFTSYLRLKWKANFTSKQLWNEGGSLIEIHIEACDKGSLLQYTCMKHKLEISLLLKHERKTS